MMLRSAVYAALTTAGLLMLGQVAQGQTVIDKYDAELGVGTNGFDAPDEQGEWCSHHFNSAGNPCNGGHVNGEFVPAAGGDPSYFRYFEEDGSGIFRLWHDPIADPLQEFDGDPPGLASALHSANGWTFTATARHVDGERFNKSIIQIQDGITSFTIQLWDGTDFGKPAGSPVDTPGAWYDNGGAHDVLQRIGPDFGQPGAIDSTDGFHKYQISLDAGGTASGGSGSSSFDAENFDDQITIWVDDVLLVGPLPRTSFDPFIPPIAAREEINIGRILNADAGIDMETHHNFWEFKTGFLPVSPPSLEADFDSSNTVDGADLTIWQTGYGLSGTAVKSDGDANADMDVDGSDFLVWQNQNGMGIPLQAGAVGVPEPSAGLLLGLALLLTGATRRRVN